MIKKIWNKLFGKGPLFTSKKATFMGHEFDIVSYNRERLTEVIEASPHGSIIFTSKKTYLIVGHLPDLDAGEQPIPEQECDGNCEQCMDIHKEKIS